MGRLRTMSDEERRYRDGLAERIRGARRLGGLSVADVERRSGIHRNLLYGYEEAKGVPSPFSLDCLARALNVSPGRLLRGVKEPANNQEKTGESVQEGTER
ncbi:MAG: helix-turn-helix transcriptional regulator [Acidobacteriaceae bacterium]